MIALSLVLLGAATTGGFLLGTERTSADRASDAATAAQPVPEPAPPASPDDAPLADDQPAGDQPADAPLADDQPADDQFADDQPDTNTAEEGDGAALEAGEATTDESSATEQEPVAEGSPSATDPSDAAASGALVAAVERYVDALDRGDLNGAHDLLAAELVSRPGWGREAFVDFWDGYLVGAELRDVVDTEEAAREVTAEVDFLLVGNGLSREIITLTMRPSNDGPLVISDYGVLRAERLR